MADIAVRPGTVDERRFVEDLGMRAIGDSISPFRDVNPVMLEASFARLLETVFIGSHDFLVASVEGTLAGFALMIDHMPDEVTLTPQAFLAYMAVEPRFRRHGVGRRLLEAIEEIARARGLPCVSLLVTEVNEAARNLYASAGYDTERRLLCKRL